MPVAKVEPIEVKSGGSVTVKIYRRFRRKGDETYPVFDVADYSSGRRKFISFADEKEARAKAKKIAEALSSREGFSLTLTAAAAASYHRSIELLGPTGISLELAAAMIAEMHQMLGGRSPVEAVRDFVRRNPSALPKKTVREVLAEMIKAKKADGMSEVYIHDLDTRLKRFCADNEVQIAHINEVRVNEWLRDLNLSARSRNNFRRAIGTLFSFAESVGYLSKGHLDMERVARVNEPHVDIEIFTPKEMSALLTAASRQPEAPRKGYYLRAATSNGIIPLLALGAFAGLRTAEIERQDWADINLERGFIRVTAAKGNTAQKRLVPVLPNLAAWLAPHRQESGPVWKHGRTEDALLSLAKVAKLKWKHNALRHSFASYRMAVIQDPAKVAYEMGNSPQMVVKHYRELVLPEEATVWFSISPETPANVTAMPAAAEG